MAETTAAVQRDQSPSAIQHMYKQEDYQQHCRIQAASPLISFRCKSKRKIYFPRL